MLTNSDYLTDRQIQVLDIIHESIRERGYPPTRKEICEKLGTKSPNGIDEHLHRLANKGVIELVPRVSRGIRVKQ